MQRGCDRTAPCRAFESLARLARNARRHREVDVQAPDAAPLELHTWEGEFVSAGATMDNDDALQGATLLWVGDESDKKLVRIGWEIDRDNKFSETGRHPLAWAYTRGIERAVVRVNPRGLCVVLLREAGGGWSACDVHDNIALLPEGFDQSKLPVEAAFLTLSEPILMCGEPDSGFRLIRLDGKPLPSRRTSYTRNAAGRIRSADRRENNRCHPQPEFLTCTPARW